MKRNTAMILGWLAFPAILLIIIGCSALTAHAAIGFDQAGTFQNVNLTVVSKTITVTSSQQNMLLMVSIYGQKSTALTVNSVVATSSPLSLWAATTTQQNNSSTWQMWYLVNPPSGTYNVTTTFSASASNVEICYATFYNVNQVTPFDNSTGSTSGFNTNSNISSTVTTSLPNEWTVDFDADNAVAGVNLGIGTGQSTICNSQTGGEHQGASFKLIPTAQTTSTYWTNGSSTWGGVAAVLEPFTTSTPTLSTDTPDLYISKNINFVKNIYFK